LKKEFELNTGVQAPPTIVAPVTEEEEVRVPERVLIPERKVETPPVEEKPAPVIETTPPPTTTPPSTSKPSVSVSTRPGRVIVYRVLENSTIRQSPDERSLELLPVVIGHRLELLEKSNDDWWKVRFRDFIGYLPARILELEE
jgi:hypothetical protein